MDRSLAQVIDISPEIQDALASGRVVALESSVIAQGLPAPQNVQVAHRCLAAVAGAGGVAATIGLIEGRVVVGLTSAQLERLGDWARKPAKAGVRDLAALIANRRDAGTTVSATLFIASLVGIRVMATGGIGGIHRRLKPTEPLDVSSDLGELARRPVCVVCAGPKAILDVPATAEALEALGVPVFGYQTSELPAFYTDSCGIHLEHRFDTAEAVASALRLHWDALALETAVLLCVRPPSPLTTREVEVALSTAIRDAGGHGMSGKEATPFLLSAVARQTEGRSVEANVELLINNARVAGLVAAAMAAGGASKTP